YYHEGQKHSGVEVQVSRPHIALGTDDSMKNTCHTLGPPAPRPLEVEGRSSRHGDNQTLTLPPPQRPPPGGPDGPAWEAQKSWMRVGSRMNEPGTQERSSGP
ncbi:hypothetical protein AMECASPLE_028028, partial [Ameca splendens]